MTLINIDSPRRSRASGFQPGRWLWLFTGFFLPLFLLLGVWQLNRATEKEQLLARMQLEVPFDQLQWSEDQPLSQTRVSGHFNTESLFLLDNKTHNGQFGYEVFCLLSTGQGAVAVSLGWVAGSQNRSRLPQLLLPEQLNDQPATVRRAPQNPLFGVDANVSHETDASVWIVQSLTTDWLTAITGQPVLGFVQLNNAEQAGVGPVIWQPTVMTPMRHRAYAVQWFAMAAALLGMFIYAGSRAHRPNTEQQEETHYE